MRLTLNRIQFNDKMQHAVVYKKILQSAHKQKKNRWRIIGSIHIPFKIENFKKHCFVIFFNFRVTNDEKSLHKIKGNTLYVNDLLFT